MSGVSQSPAFFIGWDVGGWNCGNAESRDGDQEARRGKVGSLRGVGLQKGTE